MQKILFLFLTLALSSNLIKAQKDSTYIKSYGYVFSLRGYISKDFLQLIQDSENGASGTFSPNNVPKTGIGISINNTILSFGYGHSFSFMKDKSKGNTKSFDFQLHNYSQKIVFDLFIQRYKGFFWEEEDNKDNLKICPDLSIKQYGGNIQYVFNNKKFSYKSSFVHNERQLKSAGTFLIGASIYKIKIKADSSFVYKDKNKLTNFQFGVNGGYAYTWANRHMYATIAGTLGVNLGGKRFEELLKNKIEVYPSTSIRVSVGYNKRNWTFGGYYVGNILFPVVSDNNPVVLHGGNFQFFVIRRFDKIPFINK